MSLKVRRFVDSDSGLISLPGEYPRNLYNWSKNYNHSKSLLVAPSTHFQFVPLAHVWDTEYQPTRYTDAVVKGIKPREVPYDYSTDLRHTWSNVFALSAYVAGKPHAHLSRQDWMRIERDSNVSHLNIDGFVELHPSPIEEVFDPSVAEYSKWVWEGSETPSWNHPYHVQAPVWNWNSWTYHYWYGPKATEYWFSQRRHEEWGHTNMYDAFVSLLGPDAHGAWFQGSFMHNTILEWDQENLRFRQGYEGCIVGANGFNHKEHSFRYWRAEFTFQFAGVNVYNDIPWCLWEMSVDEYAKTTGWLNTDEEPSLLQDEGNWNSVALSDVWQANGIYGTAGCRLGLLDEGTWDQVDLHKYFHSVCSPYWGHMSGSPFPSVFEQAMDALNTVDSAKAETFETLYEFTGTMVSLIELALALFFPKKVKYDEIWDVLRNNTAPRTLKKKLKTITREARSARQALAGLKDLLYSKSKRFARSLKTDPLQTSSGLYLSYSFGIAPLLREAQALRKAIKEDLPKDKVRGSNRSTHDLVIQGQIYTSEVNVLVDVTPSTRGVNKLFALLDHFGTLPTSERVWAVVPFSFLVDWFLPIGDGLKGFDHAFIRSKLWELRYLVASQKISKTLIQLEPPWKGHIVVSRYRRYSSLNWPRPEDFNPANPKLRRSQLPIGLALFFSILLPKKSGKRK